MRPRFPVASGDQQRPTPPQQLRPSPMRPVPMQQHHYNWSSTRSQQQQQQQHQHQRNRVPSPFMTPEARRNMLSMASPPMRASATTYFDSTSNSPPPSSATQMMRYINVRVAVAADSPFYNRNDEGDDGRAELNHHPHHSTDFPPTTPRASPVPCISPLTVSSETATNRRKATGSGFPYNAFVPIGENEQQQQQLPSSRLSSPASWVTRSLEASPSVFSSSIYNDHDDYDNDDDSVYFLPSFEHHGTTATAHLNKQQKQAFSPSLTAETSSVMTMDQNSIKSNLFASLAAPPVYQDQQQSPRVVSSIAPPPGMSSLAAAAAAGRCRPSSAITTPPLPKKVWMSSLAAAAAAGRSGVEIQSTSCASSTPTSALNRPHSAPTLGRPTIVDNSSSSDCKNEGDDSPQLLRKTRIKTELCLHYVSGRPCPFGASKLTFLIVVPVASSRSFPFENLFCGPSHLRFKLANPLILLCCCL